MADELPVEATLASPYDIPEDEGELELPYFPGNEGIDPDLISSQKYDVPIEQKDSNFEPEQVTVPFVSPSVLPRTEVPAVEVLTEHEGDLTFPEYKTEEESQQELSVVPKIVRMLDNLAQS